jgi:dihydrofolate reductase
MQLKISIIVAANQDGIIGINNKIPWHKPKDLQRFKQKTMNSILIMGRKTWDSLGQKELPNRQSIVVSRNIQTKNSAASLNEAFDKALNLAYKDPKLSNTVWVIGGEEIYKQSLEFVDEIDLTLVYFVCMPNITDNIATFPTNDLNGFELVQTQQNLEDLTLIHKTFSRK